MNIKKFYTKDLIGSRYKAQVGEYTYGNPKIMDWGEGATLRIGKFCSIADEVTIFLGGEHRTDWITTYPFPALSKDWPKAKKISGHPKTKGDVVIGSDVWIGYQAVILSGVNVGDGAVIGARSIVVRDVEPYSIVAGNPARKIKMRFSYWDRKKLLKMKWWNWDLKHINKVLDLLCSANINELERYYKTYVL